MAKRVSVARAKAELSALMAGVAYGGDRYIIERRSKPLAALVRVEDAERLEIESATGSRPLGALALVGAWRDVGDREIDAVLAEIYLDRQRDTPRPVEPR